MGTQRRNRAFVDFELRASWPAPPVIAWREAYFDGADVTGVELVDPLGRTTQVDIVDVEGSSEKRETFLARLAERAARRSSDTKRSVALDPMNPKDRRIIHVALRDVDGVATMSVGSGRYRQVVVVPEGSPAYEEAQRASRDSDS